MRNTASSGFRRKPPSSFWSVANRFVATLIVLGLATLVFFIFHPAITRLREMRANVERLKERYEREKIEQLRLMRKRDLLKNDPEYLENIARDKLDLMKPGETIIRLDSRQPTQQNSINSEP